jgi:parvulin-like peptidyl-prolyl isomerase
MAELFAKYSDPMADDTVTVSVDQLNQLPPAFEALKTAAEGDVVGPFQYSSGPDGTRLAVVRVKSIREAGAYTFEDVKAQLAQRLQQERQYQRIIDELRARTHIELMM